MEILDEIKRQEYICLVCHDEITAKSRVWSCDTCFRVFDLKCAQDWSSRKGQGPDWKCPHCSALYQGRPKAYKCWCKKVTNPDADQERPHSCGQTCGSRQRCPHPCTELCHPGAHPACMAMGPVIKCFCGREKNQTTCVRTNYARFSCGNPCGKSLKCKKHKCELPCHEGDCPPCTHTVKAKCYCGKTKQDLLCGSGKSERYRNFRGLFRCEKTCGKLLNCKNHECDQPCHPLTGCKHVCKRLPKATDTCPCGKTSITRESCLDTFQPCQNKCGRPLPCGHTCELRCHEGECSCERVVEKACTCGRVHATAKCSDPAPRCSKKCGANLYCGRHKCERLCCEFSKKPQKNLSIDEFLEQTALGMSEQEMAVHLCTRTCGRALSCGNHYCDAVCHPGSCRRCLEAVHEDYECACGNTTVRAPIRCGTVIPNCPFTCPIVQPCGHSHKHKCHDQGGCPPCSATVYEQCLCGKNTVSRPCNSRKPPRCVYSCGKVLACGHPCRAICHDKECPPCDSECGRPLDCLHSHRHASPCHGMSPCGPCLQVMSTSCRCGNLSCQYQCGEELEIFCNSSCRNQEPEYHAVIQSIWEINTAWCKRIEKDLREFVSSEKAAMGLKPMKRSQRKFVHYLAEHYGLVGISVDRGQQRSVRVSKTERTWLPKHSIEKSMRLQRIHGETLPVLYTEEELEGDEIGAGFSD